MGYPLSGRISQISPGKSDNLPLMTTTSTVWGSGSIGLSLVAQGRPPQSSLICGFCPLAREFALGETFQLSKSGFLRIPPHGGHPCLRLTVPATESVVDFHHQVVAHAGRTRTLEEKRTFLLQGFASLSAQRFPRYSATCSAAAYPPVRAEPQVFTLL